VHFTHAGHGLGQSWAKASHHWQLWPGLKFLKARAIKSQAKAMALRPSRAGTSLFGVLSSCPSQLNLNKDGMALFGVNNKYVKNTFH